MKVKVNFDNKLSEEKAEFWLHEMTPKLRRITQDLSGNKTLIWCYQEDEIIPVNFEEIYLIESNNRKTYVYTQKKQYEYKGPLYEIEEMLPSDFIISSRSATFNFQKIDHLEVAVNSGIDVILDNDLRVQIARRKFKELKRRLGL